ncbi:class I adenylate-forming enzyme family protein [Nocardia sp. NPDC004068]|uniref:class I adenylate-forming enzyme family protein n=1 Tax=Nocardia sp. NPDC004068 TaxID=3364303 RepID=UPI0036BA2C28
MSAAERWWTAVGGSVAAVLDTLWRNPERIITHYRGGRISGLEHIRSVTGLYDALKRAGAGPGSVVAVLTAPNSPDMITVRHAAFLLGAAVCYLRSTNPGSNVVMQSVADQTAILRETGAAVLYADDDSATRATELARHTRVAVVGARIPGAIAPVPAARPESGDPTPSAPEALAIIWFTSGSTGRPKGIRKSRWSWDGWVDSTIALGPEAEKVVSLVSTSLEQTAGPMADGTLIVGGTLVLMADFDAAQWARAVVDHAVTRGFIATTHLYRLLDHLRGLGHADAAAAGWTSLRRLVYSGSAAAPARVAEALRVIGPVVSQAYGTSEGGPATLLTPDEQRDPRLVVTVGRALPGVDLDIRDTETGESVAAEGIGEVWTRSRHTMDGYLDAALTATVLRDGWCRTGDIGSLDARGYLRLLDRVADVVKIDGAKIYPAVVEREMLTVPGIAEAVVYGVRDAEGTDHLHAAVSPVEGVTVDIDDIRARIGEKFSPAHAPERVFVVDRIPLNAGGKPDKTRLRASSTHPG